MKTEIFKDWSAFYARSDKTLNGVTKEFADANPELDKERGSDGCWNCSGCSGCSDSSPVKNTDAGFKVPKIKKIHQKVLAAVEDGKALKMDNWHSCDTAHCRGGWVIALAGKAGAELENKTNSEFAAMQIYKASSPILVSPVRFYESDEVALADIKRCAREEKEAA